MKSIEDIANEVGIKQTVFITGIGGSLGRAFAKLLHKDYNVIGCDQSEWSIAELQKEMPDIECCLMDFTDWRFDELPCDYLLHLAAFKHVDLGENNPDSFIQNNIVKTLKLFKECSRLKIPFLFVSTDKAVRPINLYGFTKAIGEKLALFYGGSVGRCGNILSSSGSVIPVWEECILKEKPIPITDERMVRYVIEDVDAAIQLWNEFLRGEKVIITKCKKVRLLDLLKEVLIRHGYKKVDDYKPGVEVIGMRPGEKLVEELEWEDVSSS